MSRRISFSMTEPQFMAGTKTVTRRLGWAKVRAGEQLTGIRKGMGLKKGERQHVLDDIEVISARRERLDAITPEDVAAEGFPGWTTGQFIAFFCAGHRGCKPDTVLTRLEFRRLYTRGSP